MGDLVKPEFKFSMHSATETYSPAANLIVFFLLYIHLEESQFEEYLIRYSSFERGFV